MSGLVVAQGMFELGVAWFECGTLLAVGFRSLAGLRRCFVPRLGFPGGRRIPQLPAAHQILPAHKSTAWESARGPGVRMVVMVVVVMLGMERCLACRLASR